MVKKATSTLRGRPKDENKAAAILKVAAEQFIAVGMSRTTMQGVANKAGVSKYTVYNHFGTKEELFQRVIQSKCKAYMSEEVLKKALSQTPYEGLRTLGMAFVGIIFDDGAIAMHRTVMSESRHDLSVAQLFYKNGPKRVMSMLSVYLKQIEDDGVCSFEDIHRAAEVFLSLFTGNTYMKAILKTEAIPNKVKLEKFMRENVDFFFQIFATEFSNPHLKIDRE